MIILDELKLMPDIMLKPSSIVSIKPNFAKSAVLYYRATAIPLLLLLIFTFFIHNQITQSIDLLFEILLWALVPLFALIQTLAVHICGKNFFASFKHGFQNTYYSITVANILVVSVLWLGVIYVPIAFVVLGLAIAWSFVALVISISANQGATRVEAFIATIVGYTLIYLLVNALAIIIVGQIPPPAA